jgi:hypothetical protein
MNRRDFLTTTAATTATVATALGGRAAAAGGPPRTGVAVLTCYHLRRGPRQKAFEDFLREAPAAGRRPARDGPGECSA